MTYDLWILFLALNIIHSSNDVGHLSYIYASTIVYIPHSKRGYKSLPISFWEVEMDRINFKAVKWKWSHVLEEKQNR